MSPIEWYYAHEGVQTGPVSAADIKQLAETGQLKPDDLVWRDGMVEWIQARKVKGLFEEELSAVVAEIAKAEPLAAPPAPGQPAFEKSAAAFERSREGGSRHLFDVILDSARIQFTGHLVVSTSRLFAVCGHYGLYIAMLVSLPLSLILGVEAKSPYVVLIGIGCLAAMAVLQYTAGRFFGALDRLNRATPGKISSAAFLDCYALLHMTAGVAALLGLAVLAIQMKTLLLILPGMAAFILCQYLAALALNPDTLNLTITSDTTAGEEAIGILSFFIKAAVSLMPVAFGVGVVWGTLRLLYAWVLLFAPPKGGEVLGIFFTPRIVENVTTARDAATIGQLLARTTAYEAQAIIVAFAALPLLAYVKLLIYQLLIDILRAILSLAGKLDRLAEGKDK